MYTRTGGKGRAHTGPSAHTQGRAHTHRGQTRSYIYRRQSCTHSYITPCLYPSGAMWAARPVNALAKKLKKLFTPGVRFPPWGCANLHDFRKVMSSIALVRWHSGIIAMNDSKCSVCLCVHCCHGRFKMFCLCVHVLQLRGKLMNLLCVLSHYCHTKLVFLRSLLWCGVAHDSNSIVF